ncbi:hypothetical protein [Cohnella sp. AR92]|uniref:hypothetical protein n=1 Tax=Cohnella sp. AR92 TaxID=648716 RepID=UPI000F8F235E|nr:hypothetical protein [Cohnella sp. AR92]RUS42243.1 hypothetical protein ELR57_26890 [Cohnella sp. AR92]
MSQGTGLNIREIERQTRQSIEGVQSYLATLAELSSLAVRLGEEYRIDPRIVATMIGKNMSRGAGK